MGLQKMTFGLLLGVSLLTQLGVVSQTSFAADDVTTVDLAGVKQTPERQTIFYEFFTDKNGWKAQKACDWRSDECPTNSWGVVSTVGAGICSLSLTEFCVESLNVISSDGVEHRAQLSYLAGVTWPSNVNLDLPSSHPPIVASLPTLAMKFILSYTAEYAGSGAASKLYGVDTPKVGTAPIFTDVQLHPILGAEVISCPPYGSSSTVLQIGYLSCLQLSPWSPDEFNLEFEVSLYSENSAGASWAFGSAQNARVSQEVNGSSTRLILSGSPQRVESFRGDVSKKSIRMVGLPDGASAWHSGRLSSLSPKLLAAAIIDGYESSTNSSMSWQFRFGSSWQDFYHAGAANSFSIFEKCRSEHSGIVGVTSTNALSLQSSPPNFDSGYLEYKVTDFHFRPDGEVKLGQFEVQMETNFARCLYGFRNAPISATVAVVGEQGEEKVATTIVSEKDGWLKLAAYGFTFSEKEIQVQLRQSQIKTLSNFTSSSLSAKQKAEIRAVLAKSDGNTKFICTGIRYYQQPMRENIKVRARAKAACEYAKSINPNFSYWYQTKTTQARSYNGKVMVVSKG